MTNGRSDLPELLKLGLEQRLGVRMRAVEIALAYYHFALMTWHQLQAGRIEEDVYREDVIFEEGDARLHLTIEAGELDLDDIAQAGVSIAFGQLASAIYDLASEIPEPRTSEEKELRAFSYQLRNCFAHNVGDPHWDMKKPIYRRSYKIRDEVIDLSELNGHRFNYAHIGGVNTVVRLTDDSIKAAINRFPELSERRLLPAFNAN